MRDALLRSAATHFSQHGYAGASTRTILADAGATAPALYHHFGSKTGLYVAAAAAAHEHVLGALRAAVANAETAPDRMSALLAATVTLRRQHPNVARYLSVVQQDVLRHPEISELAFYSAEFDVFWDSVAKDCMPGPGVAIALRAVIEGLLAVGGARVRMKDVAAAADVLDHITRSGVDTAQPLR